MKTGLKEFKKLLLIWPVLGLLIVFIGGPSIAVGGTPGLRSDDAFYATPSKTDVLKILSILERKLGNQEVSERVKEKLFTMNHQQTRLIASLSEFIANHGETVGADIAFLLITALIIS
jgi:hypothetical protein